MALPIGFLLFILGFVSLIAWAPEALVFVKGAIPFGLLVWGAVSMLVGYSERKARREAKIALGSASSEDNNQSEAARNQETASVS